MYLSPNVLDSGCDAVGGRQLKKRCPAMRRLACAVTGAPALGLLALAVLCAGAASPRRTASRAFVRATQHEEFVWREATCRRSQPRVLCLKELRPNDTRVSDNFRELERSPNNRAIRGSAMLQADHQSGISCQRLPFSR